MIIAKKLHIYIYIACIVALFMAMTVSGLNNECVPNSKVGELSFFGLSEAAKDELIERMAYFKNEHKELVRKNLHKGNMEQFLPPAGYLDEMQAEERATVDNKEIYISKNKMRWLSNNLMSPSVWDEQNTLRVLYGFRPKALDFNPHYFRYGGAWLYPMAMGIFISSKLGFVRLLKDMSYYMHSPHSIFLISACGKALGIVSYLLALLALFFITRRFYNMRVFVIASFFMVFCPMVIVESVYLKPLLTSLVWFLWAMYFIFRILEKDEGKGRACIYAGICAGLAAGSLLTSAAILLPLFIAIGKDAKRLMYVAIAFFAAFFITNPYILISFKEFAAEMMWNVRYHSRYSLFDPKIHLQNIFIFLKGVGRPFGLWALACLIWGIFNNRDKRIRIILFALLTYYLWGFSTCYALNMLHALLPVVPLLILLSAVFTDRLLSKLKARRKLLFSWLLILIAGYSILNCAFYVQLFNTSPKTEAGEWVNNNIPAGSSIGTFIDNCGLSLSYPYFSYFHYRFINDSDPGLSNIKRQLPAYYITAQRYTPMTFSSPLSEIPGRYMPYIDTKDTRGTGFVWKLNMNQEEALAPHYKEIAAFNSAVPLLGRFFKNELAYWWTRQIKVYARK